MFGTSVNTAVRISAECEPLHILASELVYDDSRELQSRFELKGQAPLKGLQEKVTLYEVAWREPQPPTGDERR